MRFWICSLLLLACVGCGEDATSEGSVGPCETRAADAAVRGQVAVPACNETLAGAEVELYDELLLNQLGSAVTDDAGEFTIPLPADGRYILTTRRGPYSGRSDAFACEGTCPYQVVLVQ